MGHYTFSGRLVKLLFKVSVLSFIQDMGNSMVTHVTFLKFWAHSEHYNTYFTHYFVTVELYISPYSAQNNNLKILLYQVWCLTEAIASVAPGLCLGALWNVPIENYKLLIEVPFTKEKLPCPFKYGSVTFNPPTDRPFETIQNFHFQKCPLVLYTHGDTI